MVKASALHLALVIALVVSILLGSLIYVYDFYRNQQQKIRRADLLRQEIQAGTSLGLSNFFPYTDGDSLFPSPITLHDSLLVGKRQWGLLDVVRIRSWRNLDSLKRAFLLGAIPQDSIVLYIVDEDRPLSISGKTVIQGVAALPKSGIRPAFVDGDYYSGIEKMVDGVIKESTTSLPSYEQDRIEAIKTMYRTARSQQDMPQLLSDRTVRRSFFEPMASYRIIEPTTLLQDSVVGNIVIFADSSVTVSANTVWKDALLIAPHIKLADDFSGQGQFFALDSLTVGKNAKLRYPSVLALLASDSGQTSLSLKIGEKSSIEGMVVLHRPKMNEQMDVLEFQKDCTVQGDVISFGLLKYSDPLTVQGSVYAYRLITQRPSSLYENYLINLDFQRGGVHPYFVRPSFWTADDTRKQAIVQWVN